MIDLHVHLLGHLDRKATKDNIRSFLEEARRNNIRRIGFADHDMYWEHLKLDFIREAAAEYPELEVRVGLEVDYREGREEEIAKMTGTFPFDYVIGSVHQIKGWFFDFPEEEANHHRQDADNLYKEYFSLVEKAARSGLFDIIGHFDLIKIFNIRPQTDVRILAASVLEVIKNYGLALEVNTNGRYKPVKEFYPEYKLMEVIKNMGIPFTLGSDAHEAGVVGRDIPEACRLLQTLGVKHIVAFSRRKKELLSLE